MERATSRRILAAALAAAVTAGCTAVGPEHVPPQVAVPSDWRVADVTTAEAPGARWWTRYGDPVLDGLVEAALRENRDLVIAAARVDRFAGQLTSVRAQGMPQVGYGADASRNRSSEFGVPALPPGADPWSTLYRGSLGASWQVDLFGRVRRLSESAQAQVMASEQARRGVVLTVTTAVVSSYILLRAFDRQLEIARATAENYARTARIIGLRHTGGVVSRVEVEQVRSQYQQALAAIPEIERQIATQENLISVLLGRLPAPIPRGHGIEALHAPEVAAGLPSSLLERRPDILQAERNLAATNADIGAARALHYPSLSLTGALGSASTSLGNFLAPGSIVVGLAAGLSGPLFTAGAIEGQVASAEAAQRSALADYQRVVLVAFAETNDALVGVRRKREESEALGQRVKALREYARLSRLKHDGGYASYLEVLYAENELFAAELGAVRTRAEGLVEVVNVHKALGGGWIDDADREAPQPSAAAAVREMPAQR